MHAQSMVSLLSCIVIKVPLSLQSLSSYNIIMLKESLKMAVQSKVGLCQVHSELWRVDFFLGITKPDYYNDYLVAARPG